MAKGGSGDVLTGVIAGLIALGLEESDAASLGVYIARSGRGKSGEALRRPRSPCREIADCLSEDRK